MKPYTVPTSGTRTVQLWVRTISGCTGAHYIAITRIVPKDSHLETGMIVREVELNDTPIDIKNP